MSVHDCRWHLCAAKPTWSSHVDLSEPLTRARFEELNSDLFKKTLGPVKKAMEDANLKKVRTRTPPLTYTGSGR